ncbi:MAG: PKD domain-containing protein [Solirubrobacteraceae bacterium]
MAMLRSLKTGTREHRDPSKLALRAVLALAASLAVVLALAAAPAGAVVTTVGPTKVGLQPREAESVFEGTPTAASFDNPEGNPVLHKNETYAIYWDPTDHYHGDWQHLIDTFFQGLGADSGSTGTVFAVDSQYTDKSNLPASYLSTFRGAYTDTDSYPATKECTDPHPLEVTDLIGPVVAKKHTEVCLTDPQVRTELKAFIAAHGLQKGVGSIFYLFTPPGVTACLDAGGPTGHCSDHTGSIQETGTESYKNSFCSYHSDFSNVTLENATTPDANTILYGVIPWTAGGFGDYHLTGADETPAYDCQDGGFDPTSEPLEKKEKAKEKKIESIKEKEEKSKNSEEQKEQEEAEQKAAVREGPHQQEPNQSAGRSPDGSYDTGLADLIVSQIGVQQQNIVTDPLLNAWNDSLGNEVTDECRNFFASGQSVGSVTADEHSFGGSLSNQSFAGSNAYINDAFNLAAGRLPYPGVPCMAGISLVPQFTAPNPVNANELVGFDGMESNITLNDDIGYSKATGAEEPKYAVYKWNFGDKTPEVTGYAPGAPSLNSPETSPCELPWKAPCAASTYHSYQYGETYNVTLTVTDTGGNTASVTEPITVVGPAAPTTTLPGGPSGPGGTTATSPVAGAIAPTSPAAPTVPAPVVTGFASSKSLKKVLRGGLAVRYSANEQVAGSIQVLLDAAVAKRLRIHGAAATGLPKGSPGAIVVGTAVLVTTKAGQGTIHVKFSASTAARLKHVRKLKLTLRLFARNASRQSPQTTTVLSTITLNP